jgi:hypothetical protein
MITRVVFPRIVLTFAIAGAAIWLALNRERLDPTLLKSLIRDLGECPQVTQSEHNPEVA